MYGQTLKQLRTVFGYSAKDMSKELDLSASYLSEIENGKKTPSLQILESYARVFNMKLSTIVLLTEEQDKLSEEGKGKIFVRQMMLKTLAKYGEV
ncbi:helix-turn-helix domain-containing protein [Lacticaseibacillus jixianensis]|uniref:Helix-turn-helix domain-containing protein n=1 Tax=Lacticaseibacillus jixianensis TaxID=2486012 RepID=A0ABW4B6P4_9LACO|nr:helix-turn-helix transcriptional regulator [Lacticaseibacillus jixianensis]